jgi:hypothetical protein
MEGAVSAALQAAREVGLAFVGTPGVSVPDGPQVAGRYPPWLIRSVVLLLAPVALLTYGWARLREHQASRRPETGTPH